jgi:hypothetical protein
VFALYREKYFDLNVRHFHENLQGEHRIRLSYTWVKKALQGAGLVRAQRQRGVHRRRRERRPLPGMMLHIDGSRHRWFQDDCWYALLVILDDATSEIYYAQLVDEESTMTVLRGLREVVEQQGIFCALYSDRASHFFWTPRASGKVDAERLTQVGRALQALGIRMIPACSPQARGVRNAGLELGKDACFSCVLLFSAVSANRKIRATGASVGRAPRMGVIIIRTQQDQRVRSLRNWLENKVPQIITHGNKVRRAW